MEIHSIKACKIYGDNAAAVIVSTAEDERIPGISAQMKHSEAFLIKKTGKNSWCRMKPEEASLTQKVIDLPLDGSRCRYRLSHLRTCRGLDWRDYLSENWVEVRGRWQASPRHDHGERQTVRRCITPVASEKTYRDDRIPFHFHKHRI